MKTVAVSKETWQKLKELKEKMGFRSFNELIETLIENWHLTALRDELSRANIDVDYNEARGFIEALRRTVGRTRVEGG